MALTVTKVSRAMCTWRHGIGLEVIGAGQGYAHIGKVSCGKLSTAITYHVSILTMENIILQGCLSGTIHYETSFKQRHRLELFI